MIFYFALYILLCLICAFTFLRAFFYKLCKVITGEDRLYSDPKFEKVIKQFALIRIFPPAIYTESQRSRWESEWWKFVIVALISGVAIILVLVISERDFS